MCLLSKKWEGTFKIVTLISVLSELNGFMALVKKNQKPAFKNWKSQTKTEWMFQNSYAVHNTSQFAAH
jgi:hypothetical protein